MKCFIPTKKKSYFFSIPNGKVYFRETKTGKPIDTYTDEKYETVNTFPIILDDMGGAEIFINHKGPFDVEMRDWRDWIMATYSCVYNTEELHRIEV